MTAFHPSVTFRSTAGNGRFAAPSRKARNEHMFSALVPIAHVCRDDEPGLIEPVGDDAIAKG